MSTYREAARAADGRGEGRTHLHGRRDLLIDVLAEEAVVLGLLELEQRVDLAEVDARVAPLEERDEAALNGVKAQQRRRHGRRAAEAEEPSLPTASHGPLMAPHTQDTCFDIAPSPAAAAQR